MAIRRRTSQAYFFSGPTKSAESKLALTARLWARCTSPSFSASLASVMYELICLMVSCWLGLSSRPAIFFRFASLVASNLLVLSASREACCGVTPGARLTLELSVPPLRTTVLLGLDPVLACAGAAGLRRFRVLTAGLQSDLAADTD